MTANAAPDDREAGVTPTCSTCFGYGLWAIGDPSRMGGMDARDGMPTIRCPECGANANPWPDDESDAPR